MSPASLVRLGAPVAGWDGSVRPRRREDRLSQNVLVHASREQNAGNPHPDVRRVDLIHPVGIPATGIAGRQVANAGFPQVAVHTRRKPFGEKKSPGLRRGKILGAELLLGAEHKAQHQVGGDVAVPLAEKLGCPAGRGYDRPHRDAEIVLGVGIAVAIAEATPVIGLNVGYTVRGAPNFSLVQRCRGFGGRRFRWLRRFAVSRAAH